MKKILLMLVVAMGLAGLLQVTNAAVDRGVWNQDTQWIDSTFWSQSPTDSDIIRAMYGTDADRDTVYSQKWNTKSCTPSTMTVSYLSPGTNTIPATLSANTVYVLSSGNYIISNKINMVSCSAIVAQGTANLYSSINVSAVNTDGMFMVSGLANVIVHGLTVDGENNGAGGTHARNVNGFFVNNTSSSTFHKLKLNKMVAGGTTHRGRGILVQGTSTYNYIHDFKASTADYGISLANAAGVQYNTVESGSAQYSTVAGISAYLSSYNTYKDIEIDHAPLGLYFYTASNNTVDNVVTHDMTATYGGIHIYSSSNNNIIQNCKSYNNSNAGIIVQGSAGNQIIGTKLFNNVGGGIVFSSAGTTNNKISKSIIYNHTSTAITLGSNTSTTTINDVLVFNNNVGIYDYQSPNLVVNNSIFLNNNSAIEEYANNVFVNNSIIANGTYGLTIDGRAGTFRTNNVKIINNTVGVRQINAAGTLTYYGDLKFINNETNTSIANVIQGTDGLGLSLSNGTMTSVTNANLVDEVVNPYNETVGTFLYANSSCTYPRGRITSWTTSATAILSYWFGANLLLQKQPYEYTTSFVTSALSWNAANKIGWIDSTNTPLKNGFNCAFASNFTVSAGALNGVSVGAAVLPKAVPQQLTFSRNNRTTGSQTAKVLGRILSPKHATLTQGTGEVTFNVSVFKSSTLFGAVSQ